MCVCVCVYARVCVRAHPCISMSKWLQDKRTNLITILHMQGVCKSGDQIYSCDKNYSRIVVLKVFYFKNMNLQVCCWRKFLKYFSAVKCDKNVHCGINFRFS